MIVLLMAIGCGPPPLDTWTGCLSDHARLVRHEYDGLAPADGGGAVLSMQVRWGGLPWITDDERAFDLVVELPEPARVGSFDLTDLPKLLREPMSRTERIEGRVEVVEVEESEVVLALDLGFQDFRGTQQHLVGRSRLRRGRGPYCQP